MLRERAIDGRVAGVRAMRRGGLVALIALGSMLAGCSNAVEGGASGAALGALAGLGIGSLSGNAGAGAAIGAISGAVAGGVIGDQNNRREDEQARSRW